MKPQVIILSLCLITLFMVGCVPASPPIVPYDTGLNSTPPISCNGTYRNFKYYDTDDNLICFCNGANWVKIENRSSTCT